MKPKGGAKCSRRSHSLWLKQLESRKRVRLARKSFWSQGDLEALTFTESEQLYMQEGGSGRDRPARSRPGARLGQGRKVGLNVWKAAPLLFGGPPTLPRHCPQSPRVRASLRVLGDTPWRAERGRAAGEPGVLARAWLQFCV